MTSISQVARRWLYGAALFLAFNGFFVARVPNATRPELAWVSGLFVMGLALPSFVSLGQWLGWGRALAALLGMGVFAVVVETVGVKTGFPYGEFMHKNEIGWKILGLVPWTVPLAWIPLILGAFALASRWIVEDKRLIVLAALLLVAVDGVLDPGAVHQGFWSYKHPGFYYGVPASNFVGWFLSASVGTGMLYAISRQRREPAPPGLASSLFLILTFWSSVCLFAGLLFPGFLGLALLLLLHRVLFAVTRP